MKPALTKQLDRLDKNLADLFEVLNKYSDDDLNWQPKPGKWSVMQILVHMMMAENGGMQYMQKKLSSGDSHIPKAGVLAACRQILLTASLRSPFKFKAPPAVDTDQLPARSAFWDIVKQWNQQRADLRTYLLSMSDQVLAKEIYRHPVSGRSNAKGMLKFYEEHFRRHRKQIEHILQNYRY